VTERIFLIGFRGAGKTTVARLLAERLGWSWCDADHILEERHGKTIRQIFDEEGEASFRDKETAVLRELATRTHSVIATGGGVVLRPENHVQLTTGVTIWLTAAPRLLWQRLQADATTAQRRPNLSQGGLAEIEEMLRIRQPLYEECADWTVDATAPTPEQVTAQILTWLQGHGDILKS
jgi:shikimate kinase